MTAFGILVYAFLAFWAGALLWGNFEAWFRPEKVMQRMRKDAQRINDMLPEFWPGKDKSLDDKASRWPWLKSIEWYRALIVAFDIFAFLVFYSIFRNSGR